ncbi:hypothetical protein C8Q70DRAFT_978332 [Cubamyces menziesii]|nr:hypothetical protein C8Q70DRAFT_978332 [Cubamyces menziesii]
MSKNDLLLAGTLRGCAFDVPRGSAADCMHHRVTLGECTYSRAALVGRRTVVYAAQAHPPFAGQKPAERIVAKLSYQSTARTAEYELIERARRAGVPHIPTVHGYHDLFDLESLQDGIRARIVDHCGVFDNYENRVARVLVSRMYTPLLQRLHKQPLDLIRMVDQMSESLHCLRYDAKILHRDVSVRNIMCEETEKGPNFILGDFDLAIVLNEDGTSVSPTGKRHVGTLPFMAQKLVEDLAYHPDRPRVLHELHHDYESLYWVALWCTMKADYDEQEPTFQRRIDHFLAQWEPAVGRSDSQDATTRWDSDSETQPETISTATASESKLNLLEIIRTKTNLLINARICGQYTPTTKRFAYPGIFDLIHGFRLLLVNAYVRDTCVAADKRLTRPSDHPRETGDTRADETSIDDDDSDDTNDDDDTNDVDGDNEEDYASDSSTGTDTDISESEDEDDNIVPMLSMRDLITRQAIKQVIESADKAARREQKAAHRAQKAARREQRAARKEQKAARKKATENGPTAGPNNVDNDRDDSFWTRTEDAYVDKASIIMPMRDTITREAIKRVVETTKAAVRSHLGV